MLRHFFSIIFLCFTFNLQSQYIKPSISQTSNYYLYTSSNNLTYISSFDGLNIYNGWENKIFRPSINDMIGNQIQGEFIEDEYSRVWFATYEGLNYHDPAIDQIKGFQLTKDDTLITENYRTIGMFNDTLIVQAGNYTFLFDIISKVYVNSFKTMVLNYHSFVVKQDESGLKLIASGNPGVMEIKIDYKTCDILRNRISKIRIRSSSQIKDKVFFGGFRGGLFNYDYISKEFRKVFDLKNTINNISEFNESVFLNVENKGSYLFDKENFQNKSLLNKNNIEAIQEYATGFIDQNGVLWEGIVNEGPRFSSLIKNKFNFIKTETATNNINYNDSRILIGRRGNGYYELKDDFILGQLITNRTNKGKFTPSNIVSIDSNYYCYYYGLRKYDISSKIISSTLLNSNVGEFIGNVLSLNNEIILIGREKPILKYDVNLSRLDTLYERSLDFTNAQVLRNKLFVSYDDKMILVLNMNGDSLRCIRTFEEISGEIKFASDTESEDSVLISTARGLFKANFKTGKSRVIVDKDKLLAQAIYAAYPDSKGNLWCSSNSGILKYNPKTNKAHQFTEADGVQGMEFNTHAHLQLDDGTIIFGGINGLNIFHPDSITLSKKPAPVILTDYRINDTSSMMFGAPLVLENVELPYDQNTLSFLFHAIDYGDPEATRVKYKLIGEDNNYVKSTTARGEVRYANLSSGMYTLSLIGSNSDGVWNQDDKQISITILPPWYATWWARTLGIFLLGGITYSSVKLYYNRKLKEKDLALREANLTIEKQTALSAERTRIASEMHDDLGGGLTTIKFLSQKVMRKTSDTTIKSQVKKIVHQSETLVNNMSEIIWAMNAGFDTLSSLVSYSRRYANEYLETHGIDLKFQIDGKVSGIVLTGTERRNIFLVIKEVLHNAVKHADCTQMNLTFIISEDLTVVIRDDGTGISNTNELGHGLNNMKQRMKNIGGSLEYENDGGLVTTLRYPNLKKKEGLATN